MKRTKINNFKQFIVKVTPTGSKSEIFRIVYSYLDNQFLNGFCGRPTFNYL